jgi:hypothetical protein
MQRYLPKRIFCYERTKIDRVKSYHSLQRDLSFNTPIDSRKRMEMARYGQFAGQSRMFLNFTWKVVVERWRSPVPAAPADPGWRRWAILRQLMPRWW